MAFNLQDIDQHLANLRSAMRFFSEVLDGTDHNAPDWLATDLVSLRNKAGRLGDDVQKFRDQVQREGIAQAKPSSRSHGRLSLEGGNRSPPAHNRSSPIPPQASNSPPPHPHPQPYAQPQPQPQPQHTSPPKVEYEVQHVDVTEEVNRRLRESRLRRLMDSASTSQKRKFDAMDTSGLESAEDTEGDQEDVWEGRSPTKKIRASGSFEPVSALLKRKEDGITVGFQDVGKDLRGPAKRRRR